jgi:hypothetical protein
MSKVPDTSALMSGTVNAQVMLSYTSDPAATTVDLVVSAGDESAKATYNPGSLTFGDALSPSVYNPPLAGGPSFLSGTSGKYVGGLLALAALILLAYGIGLIFFRDRSQLDNALLPYADSYVSESDEDEDPNGSSLAQTRVLQRAVELTGQFAENRGFLTRVEGALERADMPLRAAEAIFFYVALSVVVTALVLVLSQNLIVTALVLAGLIFLPPTFLNHKARRRQAAFVSQLPDTLQLLSARSAPATRCSRASRRSRRRSRTRWAASSGESWSKPASVVRSRRHSTSGHPHGQPGLRVGRHGDPHPT